jgi:hypothetical protein
MKNGPKILIRKGRNHAVVELIIIAAKEVVARELPCHLGVFLVRVGRLPAISPWRRDVPRRVLAGRAAARDAVA